MAAGATMLGEQLRELAYRENDGIHVTLLWNGADDSLLVIVLDERRGGALQLPAAAHNALDVFNHPFAYV